MTRFTSLMVVGFTLLAGAAWADPKVALKPAKVIPGQAVLVSVTDSKAAPSGTAGEISLQFYPTKAGYQAVFAIPLETKPGEVVVKVDGAPAASVVVAAKTFPATSVIVEDELANPGPEDRKAIDADNAAIIEATRKSNGEAPQFTGVFKQPSGKVTSTFGEWRTFNDGHKSQHLGLDTSAAEGSKVKAINSGTVVLVRSTFLAGNTIVISHGAGIASTYYHLSKPTVTEGTVVAVGDPIGLAGHTGRTTGPHLHLSVRVPGGFVDPKEFFALKVAPVRTIRPIR